MRRSVLCVLISGLVTFLSASLALAQPAAIGLEWSPGDLEVIVVADMNWEAGLEFIGRNAYGSMGLYRLATGELIGAIPAVFDSPQTTFVPRDVDGDGVAEIFCALPQQFSGYRLGVIDADGMPQLLWQAMESDESFRYLEVVNLSAAEPQALALINLTLKLYSPQTGDMLYDSGTDPDLNSRYAVGSYLIDDFDADGRQEILLSLVDRLLMQTVLIGDRTVAGSGVETPAIGRALLRQNAPNPFNGGTTISYEMDTPGRVRLRIFDTAGRLVRTVADGYTQAGSHQALWNGRDDSEHDVASGIYFYELDVEGQRQTRKLVQIR